VRRADLSVSIGTLIDQEHAVKIALDMLLSGF
jgi:hypothetical protein